MDKQPFSFLILFLLITSLACGLPETLAPTPEPTPIPTITLAPVIAAETTVPVEPTTTVLPTETVSETEASVATEESTPEPEGTEGAGFPPVVDGEVFGPGQKDTRNLAGGDEQIYLIDGVEFKPRFIFAETSDEVDLLLEVAGTEANFSGPGGAEVLVFSADANGRYDLIVRNQSEEAGEYTIYLYDAAQTVPGAVHRPDVTLAEGQTEQVQVESRDGRPVLIFVEPVDKSDVGVVVTTTDGQVVADANYSGAGSAEAAYVLPRETTRYTVTIREINNAPSQMNVLLVPLE